MKILTLILVTIGTLAPIAASGPAAEPDVVVKQEQGVYRVRARFDVPEAPEIALAVLKDYEQIPRFMPDLRTSVIRDRSGARVVVEQEAVARLLMFSKRVHLVLEIVEQSDSLQFTDLCGRSFTRYAGVWRVVPLGGGTFVTYELTAKPSFSVPEFVLSKLLRRDATVMIERLRREISARGRVDDPRVR